MKDLLERDDVWLQLVEVGACVGDERRDGQPVAVVLVDDLAVGLGVAIIGRDDVVAEPGAGTGVEGDRGE